MICGGANVIGGFKNLVNVVNVSSAGMLKYTINKIDKFGTKN